MTTDNEKTREYYIQNHGKEKKNEQSFLKSKTWTDRGVGFGVEVATACLGNTVSLFPLDF